MNKIRTAMVGVGGFGAFRRRQMRDTGLFELVAAYDHNPTALQMAQAEDGAAPTASYAELLDTSGIEAVVISTGAIYHSEHALAAMDRGLHVFVEKPLCATPAEIGFLLERQRQTGCVVVVGHVDHAHDAQSCTIRHMLDQGDFGKLVTFEKTTAHSGGLEIKPGDWRGNPAKNPGGMLFQCGVHALHELMFYFGPVRRVFCTMRDDLHDSATADIAHCILEFDSGLTGTLNAYHITPYRHSLDIFGTALTLHYEARYYGEPSVLDIQRRSKGTCEPREPLHVHGETDAHGALRSFYHAIRDGSPPSPSLIDGARAVAVVFAAEDSAKSAKVVDVHLP